MIKSPASSLLKKRRPRSFPKKRKNTVKNTPRGIQKETVFLTVRTSCLVSPAAWDSDTEGRSMTETAFVRTFGKKNKRHGHACKRAVDAKARPASSPYCCRVKGRRTASALERRLTHTRFPVTGRAVEKHAAEKRADRAGALTWVLFCRAGAGEGKEAEKQGGKFAQDEPCDSGCGRQGTSFRKRDPVNEKDGCHADNLFKKLRGGRNSGFFQPVIVACNTGMAGAEGDGQRHDAQKLLTARLVQKIQGCQIQHSNREKRRRQKKERA